MFPHRRLDTKDAAKYCGLSQSQMAKLRLSGEGPVFLKICRTVRYNQKDLDDWLAQCRRVSTSQPPNVAA